MYNAHMATITDRPEWRDAAEQLIRAGYTVEPLDGLIPARFHRGEEIVYLYRPVLDRSYEYQEGECWRVEFGDGKPVLTVPAPLDELDRRKRPWVPRPWASRPVVGYTIRDAAEHTGKSISTLKRDMYLETDNPLKPTTHISGKRIPLFSEERLLTWLKNNPDGKKAGAPGARQPVRKSRKPPVRKSQRIYQTLERLLREGSARPDRFAEALSEPLGRTPADLADLAGSDPRLFVELVKKHLNREQVVSLMTIA